MRTTNKTTQQTKYYIKDNKLYIYGKDIKEAITIYDIVGDSVIFNPAFYQLENIYSLKTIPKGSVNIPTGRNIFDKNQNLNCIEFTHKGINYKLLIKIKKLSPTFLENKYFQQLNAVMNQLKVNQITDAPLQYYIQSEIPLDCETVSYPDCSIVGKSGSCYYYTPNMTKPSPIIFKDTTRPSDTFTMPDKMVCPYSGTLIPLMIDAAGNIVRVFENGFKIKTSTFAVTVSTAADTTKSLMALSTGSKLYLDIPAIITTIPAAESTNSEGKIFYFGDVPNSYCDWTDHTDPNACNFNYNKTSTWHSIISRYFLDYRVYDLKILFTFSYSIEPNGTNVNYENCT
jgi:hypothetical protein